MNILNYATLEASQRLVEEGVLLETDSRWMFVVGIGWKVFHKDDPIHKCNPILLPAPCFIEVWRELPPNIDTLYFLTVRKQLKENLVGYEYNKKWVYYVRNSNLADALINLLIWIKTLANKDKHN